jgi:HSP20 family molecular chaperone IbpA
MSNVITKNLILSQPKSGVGSDVKAVPSLTSEISHDDSSTTIKVEVPGVDPSTVRVECENNILHVGCEKGSFVYSVDPTVDTSKIKADIQWGLLTLTVPAPPAPVSHSIKVSVHDTVKSAPTKSVSKFTSEE